MSISRPQVIGNRFRTSTEALRTVPGADQHWDFLNNLLYNGTSGQALIDALKPVYGNRSEDVANQLSSIQQGEYALERDPQGYVQSLANENRATDYGSLTDSELQQRLSDLQFLSNLGVIAQNPTKTLTTKIGPEGGTFGTTQNQIAIDLSAYKPDIQALQGLVESRQAQAQKEADINNYLQNELPSSLTAQRENFLSGQSAQAQQMFDQEIRPVVSEQANVRGLFNSGYIPTALTAKATDIQSSLDSQRANLENTDYQFLADAAYKNKVRQLLEGQQDYRSALLNEQQTQLTDQSNRFTASQNSLNQDFQSKLAQENYDLQLKQQQAALKRQQDLNQSSRNSSTLGSVGSALGAIGGAAVGGPVGAQVGMTLGGAAGNSVKGA